MIRTNTLSKKSLFLYEEDINNINAVPHRPIDDSQGAYGGE